MEIGPAEEAKDYPPDPVLKPCQPTKFKPGDPRKIEVLAKRYRNGEELHHPEDTLDAEKEIPTRRSNFMAGVFTTGMQVRKEKDRKAGERVRVRGEINGKQIDLGTYDLNTEQDSAQQLADILRRQQEAARRDRKIIREIRRQKKKRKS